MAKAKDQASVLSYARNAHAKTANRPEESRTVGAVVDTDPHELHPNPLQTGLFDLPTGDELARLKDDIQQNGIHDPLQAMMDGTILAGHTRLKIALALKMKTVPVLWVATKTPEDQRAFLIRDNLHRRQLTPEDKARLLAELYPGYFDADSTAGRKPEKSGNGYPISAPAIAAEIGTSEKTVKNMKATHKAAKQIATAQGRPAPTPEDYKAAAAEKKQVRRERETRGPQDLPGQADIDRKNRNTPAPKVSGPVPILEGILASVEGKHKTAAARAALADLRTRLQAAGLLP